MGLTLEERRTWLRQVPLFRGVSEDSLARLSERTTEASFEPDANIVVQGQVGNGLFIVVSGSARVLSGERELARVGPGAVIGELSVIDQQPRVATVVAEGPVTCLALASWDLLALLETDPRLGRNLLGELAARLRAANALIGH
jgi:CRP-like cAMP-binding protein